MTFDFKSILSSYHPPTYLSSVLSGSLFYYALANYVVERNGNYVAECILLHLHYSLLLPD
jgi:hypothetical protein